MILETQLKDKRFRIEEDNPDVGTYLYIFKDEVCISDYLQSDIETCKYLAFELFSVPLSSWDIISRE